MGKGLEALFPQSGKKTAADSDEKTSGTEKTTPANSTKSKSSGAKSSGSKTTVKTTAAKGSTANTKKSSTSKNAVAKAAVKDTSVKKPASKNAAPGSSVTKNTSAKEAAAKSTAATHEDAQKAELRVTEIIPNKEQPRKEFTKESIDELAESIRNYGVLQPVLVQKKGKYYEIIAGERRWRAAKAAGLKKIPVIIREFTEQEAMEISLIENIQREDLNVIEEAEAYQRLLDEFHLKQEGLAERVSKSRTAITNSLRLLKLDPRIQQMLISSSISMGHARALLTLEDKELQFSIAQRVANEKLSVREVERLVKQVTSGKAPKKETKPDPQIQAVFASLEKRLQKATGTKVSINNKRGNKGKIEIEYYSQDDLERIIELIS